MNRTGGAVDLTTLVEILRDHARATPDRQALTFLPDGERGELAWTYGELDLRARAIAAALQAEGAEGGRAVLLYPPGLDYVAAFFGCLYAGVVAVPAYPPEPARLARTLPRLQKLLADADAGWMLSTGAIAAMAGGLGQIAPDLAAKRWIATDVLPAAAAGGWTAPEIGPSTLAFLQYTSGSTGAPRGVALDHANLLHNSEMIRRAFRLTARSTLVTWLPPYHDMGLIGAILQPLLAGFPVKMMPPLAFLQRPMRWLESIARTRATVSGGPNFAFGLCVRKSTEEERARLDLSSWETAFCGAEPIRPGTMEAFARAFAVSGLRREALYPCYGLAEATLLVSGGRAGEPIKTAAFDRAALAEGRVVPTATGGPGGPGAPGAAGADEAPGADEARSAHLVSCGHDLPGQQIVIVDPASGLPCEAGRVGEIWVTGASVARAYWGRPEETAAVLAARLPGDERAFLRTGDLGFFDGGELFVVGRIKDLVIVRGRNLYPSDLEETAERAHRAIRPGGCAAFAVDAGGEEAVVIVAEATAGAEDAGEAGEAVFRAIVEAHDVGPAEVVLIAPGTLSKTSSGKVQRRATREAYLAGQLERRGGYRAAEAGGAARGRAAEAKGVAAAEGVAASAPLGGRERVIAALAARVLGVRPEQIDPGEPLTRYGLDSLRAAELDGVIEERLGVGPGLGALLTGMTVREAAAAVGAAVPPVRAPEADDAGPDGDEAPLTPGQAALWLAQQLAPASTAYVISREVRIRSAVDAAALAEALRRLVARHPALRAVFVARDGEPRQRVRPEPALDFQAIDARAERPEWLAARIAFEQRAAFDLEHGPLLRVRLVTLGDEDHVLLFAVHHLVADFWSLVVLVHELGALYGECRAGVPAAPARPASAYTRWVRRERAAATAAEARDLPYWREALAGAPEAFELPADRARPAAPSGEGAGEPFALDAETSARVRALAREAGTTPFVVLLACFQALLHRVTGQGDVIVGSSSSGRRDRLLADVVGYFVNPVVLRTQVDGAGSLRELVARTRAAVAGALEHRELPFPTLVERLAPRRAGTRSPLFQIAFVLQQSHLQAEQGLGALALAEAGARVQVGELVLEAMASERRAAPFDVTVMMAESGGRFAGAFEYDAALFERETIAMLARRLASMVATLTAAPGAPIEDVDRPSPDERRLVCEELATGEPGEVPAASIPALFEAEARRRPAAVAFVGTDATLTYGELDARAGGVARALAALGVGPDHLVGLRLGRTAAAAVGLLGILKAGGAYLPLDAAYPEARLRFMIEDSGLSVVVTDGPWPDAPPGLRVVQIEGAAGAGAAGAADADDAHGGGPVALSPSNLAYVIYTSGSTGRPKGVGVEHRGVVRLVRGATYMPFGEGEVFLQLAPLGFDASTFEIWGALLNGGRLVQCPVELPTAAVLREVVERHGVTTVFVTAGLFHQLVDEGLEGMPTLRRLFSGGDAVSAAHVARAMRQLPHCRFVNAYGPTENSTYTTVHAVTRADRRALPIGRPIARTQAYVLDRVLRPLPVGVPGELYVGGDGLARGYLNRPELTAERFVPSPFGPPGARLYRTGDVARWQADGTLDFVGRVDQQVKVRGFRVELGEIEANLAACPGVAAAAVTVLGDGAHDKRLVALWVPDGAGGGSAGVKAALARTLPPYMLPSRFVRVGALPLLASGKVDRGRLAALAEGAARGGLADEADEADGEAYVAPRSDAELQMARLWAEVLGRERVGATDDFFSIGGHSLLAARLVARVQRAGARGGTVRDLFEHPTVESFVRRVGARAERAAGPTIQRAPRDGELPLSFAEERLWFLHALGAGASYNVPGVLRLRGALDAAALARSLEVLAARHEILRTRYPATGGAPRRLVDPDGRIELSRIDLRGLPAEVRAQQAREHARAEAQAVFDLAAGPLARATLVALADEDHELLLTLHHIVTDGLSVALLLRELVLVYSALARGEAPALPELPIQYADYAAWQRGAAAGAELARSLAAWRRALAGAPPQLALPTDRPRPPVQTYRGARLPIAIDGAIAGVLAELGRRHGATLYMVLLAAYQVLLHRYAGQDDVVVGSPVANRTRPELEPVAGCFVNTLALRARIDGAEPFAALLAQVREVCVEAFEHQALPFEKLVEELRPQRDLSRTPLFQVMFALETEASQAFRIGALAAEIVEGEHDASRFDLTLDLHQPGGRGALAGAFEYNVDLFAEATIARLGDSYLALLGAIARDASARVDDLPLLTAAARARVVAGWNATRVALPAQASIVERFERRAAEAPGLVAIVDGERRVSYGELDRRANALAHELAGAGLGPEDLVAMCLPRSAEAIVAMLGILKAGAAVLPLDPDYPRAWLASTLRDSGARRLVSDGGMPELEAGAGLPVSRVARGGGAAAGEDGAGALPARPPEIARHPDTVAYVIYTSGSTGAPKGVLVSHRAVINRIAWGQLQVPLGPDDAMLQSTSFGFDVSIWEIFTCLLSGSGARLVLAPPGKHDPAALVSLVARERVTAVGFVPSLLQLVLDEPGIASCTSLRHVFLGGEAMPAPLRDACFRTLPGARLYNYYGLTETAIDATHHECRQDDAERGARLVPIGRPIGNVRAYVLDARLAPVPPGVPGELYLGGVALARGYLGRPDATAERFIPDPLSGLPGERLYRTGDLVRQTPEGELVFLGRLDHQTKIRGHRIELAEIETVLGRHPAVEEVAVLVRKPGAGGDPARAEVARLLDEIERLSEADARAALERATAAGRCA